MRENIQACIFDLDGVIVDTAKYHFIAWQRIAHSLNIPLTEIDNEALKGISRVASLEKIVEKGNIEISEKTKKQLLSQKNEWYLEFLEDMDRSELLSGVLHFLNELRLNKIRIALGSASKNARKVLDILDIAHLFDVIIDGNDVINSKPNPEVFIKGAQGLNVMANNSVVFEDSMKGIEAAIAGGFKSIGIGGENLNAADYVIPGFDDFGVRRLNQLYSNS